jgi:hypothetical protein
LQGRAAVPRICEFYGIAIYIYYDDHNDPHFHAIYGDDEVEVKIGDLSVAAGRLPPRAMGLVIEWASSRQSALDEDWKLAEQHLPLKKIRPLK